jgi:hypothetical protein
MQNSRTIAARAALLLAGATLLVLPPSVAGTRSDEALRVSCNLRPSVLDVHESADVFVVRIELFSTNGLTELAPEDVEPGVSVSSVGGVSLPPADGSSEGIGEARGGRSFEDTMDVGGRALLPNGVRELVVRFVKPCDGDPATRDDGNAGDILAMLMDRPDGESVEVCIAGRHDSRTFECCDAVTVRNRGLRGLPRGLLPARGSDLP